MLWIMYITFTIYSMQCHLSHLHSQCTPKVLLILIFRFIEWLSYLCRYATYGPEYVYPQVYGTPSWLEQSKFTYFEGLMFLLC